MSDAEAVTIETTDSYSTLHHAPKERSHGMAVLNECASDIWHRETTKMGGHHQYSLTGDR